MTDSNAVFKALADESRRTLLDQLYRQDGQTLSELERCLPMTRFGVMKHLRALEGAGLITTEKVGRAKYHYLNPVPIQLIYDRWVSKFSRRWTQSLADLKHRLEQNPMSDKHANVYQIFIRITPEALWDALTSGEMTRQYYFGTRIESDWTIGSPYAYVDESGISVIRGEIIEVDPPKRLVTTFQPLWEGGEAARQISRVTFDIEVFDETCRLKVIHDDLDPEQQLTQGIMQGWAQILSGLKTLLETGQPMAADP